MSSKWGWYNTLYSLANGDILNIEKVTNLGILEVLTFLAYSQDYNNKKKTIMITFEKAIGFLETIATKHFQIKSFHSGDLDEVDINKLGAEDYIILYAEPSNATMNTGVLTYTFTIYVMDMINEKIGDAPNKQRLGRLTTYSETLRILNDVIAEFKQNLNSKSYVDDEVVLQLPITCEPFTARFDNLLTGWSASITIDVNNKNNLCIAPILHNS